MEAIKQHISGNLRFLVIQTAFLGDALLATALLEDLHKAYPQSDIDFLVRQDAAPLFKNHPFISRLLIRNKKEGYASSLFKLANEIRDRHYTAIFNAQRFAATGWLTVQAQAGYTAGFNKSPFSTKFTLAAEHLTNAGLHEIERNRLLIAEWVENPESLPKIYPDPASIEKVKNLLPPKYLVIAPGSVWQTKRTPIEVWSNFLKQLKPEIPIVFIGGHDEKPFADLIIKESGIGLSFNYCGHFSLIESAVTISNAVITYSNDSAPIHLASCMNAPIAAMFCNTVPAFGFGPVSQHSWVIETEEILPCRPCGLTGKPACPLGHFKCGTTLPTSKMINSFYRALQVFEKSDHLH